jgi:hypothetical protein
MEVEPCICNFCGHVTVDLVTTSVQLYWDDARQTEIGSFQYCDACKDLVHALQPYMHSRADNDSDSGGASQSGSDSDDTLTQYSDSVKDDSEDDGAAFLVPMEQPIELYRVIPYKLTYPPA